MVRMDELFVCGSVNFSAENVVQTSGNKLVFTKEAIIVVSGMLDGARTCQELLFARKKKRKMGNRRFKPAERIMQDDDLSRALTFEGVPLVSPGGGLETALHATYDNETVVEGNSLGEGWIIPCSEIGHYLQRLPRGQQKMGTLWVVRRLGSPRVEENFEFFRHEPEDLLCGDVYRILYDKGSAIARQILILGSDSRWSQIDYLRLGPKRTRRPCRCIRPGEILSRYMLHLGKKEKKMAYA
jgi:hypothetical protein